MMRPQSARRTRSKRGSGRSPMRKISRQYHFPGQTNILTTERLITQRTELHDKMKEGNAKPSAIVRSSIELLALSRLVAKEQNPLIIFEAHCRASDAYLIAKKYSQASQHAIEAIGVAKDNGFEVPPEAFICLGRSYFASKDYEKGKDIFEEAICTLQDMFGKDCVEQCEALTGIADILWKQRKYDISIDTLADVLRIQESSHGTRGKELVPTYVTLGEKYLSRRDHQNALEFFLRAIEISQEHEIDNTKSYAKLCISAAWGYARWCMPRKGEKVIKAPKMERERTSELTDIKSRITERMESAFHFFQKGLLVYRTLLGSRCSEAMRILEDMATIYIHFEDYPAALGCLGEVLEAVRHKNGPCCQEAAVLLKRIGDLLILDNNKDTARNALNQSLRTFGYLGGENRYSALMSAIKKTLKTIQTPQSMTWIPNRKRTASLHIKKFSRHPHNTPYHSSQSFASSELESESWEGKSFSNRQTSRGAVISMENGQEDKARVPGIRSSGFEGRNSGSRGFEKLGSVHEESSVCSSLQEMSVARKSHLFATAEDTKDSARTQTQHALTPILSPPNTNLKGPRLRRKSRDSRQSRATSDLQDSEGSLELPQELEGSHTAVSKPRPDVRFTNSAPTTPYASTFLHSEPLEPKPETEEPSAEFKQSQKENGECGASEHNAKLADANSREPTTRVEEARLEGKSEVSRMEEKGKSGSIGGKVGALEGQKKNLRDRLLAANNMPRSSDVTVDPALLDSDNFDEDSEMTFEIRSARSRRSMRQKT
ncbi:hypothetical protein AAMO2058_001128600 [Amorphochlora amoebiformis]